MQPKNRTLLFIYLWGWFGVEAQELYSTVKVGSLG